MKSNAVADVLLSVPLVSVARNLQVAVIAGGRSAGMDRPADARIRNARADRAAVELLPLTMPASGLTPGRRTAGTRRQGATLNDPPRSEAVNCTSTIG